jgi:hypothetical protein
VTGVGDQLALTVPRRGQGTQHGVEGAREPGDLVVALDLDRVELLGAGDVLGGIGQPAYGTQAVAGDGPAGEGGRDHPCGAVQEEAEAQALQRRLVGVQGLGDDECDPVRRGGDRGHAVVVAAAADRAAGVVAGAPSDGELRCAQDDLALAQALGGDGPPVGGDVPDRRVAGPLDGLRDVALRVRLGVVAGGRVGAPVEGVVEGGEQLVADGEVGGERHQGHGDADRDGGEHDDPAGQRAAVAEPLVEPADGSAHGPAHPRAHGRVTTP